MRARQESAPRNGNSANTDTEGETLMESVILPPEREVHCACDVGFHRPVLRDHTGINERVSACLHCGTVTITESLVEEPRPHDVRCVGNRIMNSTPEVLTWLGEWGRLAWSVWQDDRQVYLPATLRCATTEELNAKEREALTAQAGQTYRERLLVSGVPKDPAPPELPSVLRSFAQTWRGLQWTAETDLETLLAGAESSNWASPFATEWLAKRPHIVEEITQLILSPAPSKRQVGLDLAARRNPCELRLIAAILLRLRSFPLPEQELHSLLNTILAIGNTAPEVRSVLEELADKIGNRDYYLRVRVEQVCSLLFPKPIRHKNN
jgi:hypothetical protein